MIKQLIKNWMYPAGKFETIDDLKNKKGESLEELFERRDALITERIHNSYPTLLYELYMALPTTGRFRRLKGKPKDCIGAVYDAEANRLTLYRLIGEKDV